MSAKRTQIYLTEEQRARIDQLADAEGSTMAEVIRRAVDRYLDGCTPDPGQALKRTFGLAPDAAAPDRGEWARG